MNMAAMGTDDEAETIARQLWWADASRVPHSKLSEGRCRMNMSKSLTVWLGMSIAAALIGAIMLYPIGSTELNVVFVLVKTAMVTGLLVMLLAKKRRIGFAIWAVASICAVIMTILKWMGTGSAQPLFVMAIVVDVIMPLVAYRLMGSKPADG